MHREHVSFFDSFDIRVSLCTRLTVDCNDIDDNDDNDDNDDVKQFEKQQNEMMVAPGRWAKATLHCCPTPENCRHASICCCCRVAPSTTPCFYHADCRGCLVRSRRRCSSDCSLYCLSCPAQMKTPSVTIVRSTCSSMSMPCQNHNRSKLDIITNQFINIINSLI